MQLRRWALGGVLAASLALNGYLVIASPHRSADHAVAGHPRVPVVHRVEHAPPPSRPAAAAPVVIPAEVSALDRGALEFRPATDEKELDRLTPLEEKFELGDRAPTVEARLAALLDQALVTDDGASASYDLECRGTICRISNIGMKDSWGPLQHAPELLGVFGGMSMSPDEVYAQVAAPDTAAGWQLENALFTALLTSPAARACKTPDAHHGSLNIGFALDASTRALHATASGTLADDVLGICVRTAAEAIAAQTRVPSEVTTLPSAAEYPYVTP